MDLQTRIYESSPPWVQTALLNLHARRIQRHRYGPPYEEAVTWLREAETWSRDQIRDHQSSRLRRIVGAAYDASSYYRRIFDARGLSPADITTVDDLGSLPILSKSDVKANASQLLTGSPDRDWLSGHTSGTTGSPLSLWYDRETCVMTNAVDRRHKMWAGMSSSDWIGLFLGRAVVPINQDGGAFWRTNWVQRQIWFSSFHMSPDNLDSYVDEIRSRRLEFLEGYPSTLYILANHVRSRNAKLPMTAVITSSETLHPIQRTAIEEAFDCQLFDFYAQAERVVFAGECSHHTGKHVAEEYGFLEIVDDNGRAVEDGVLGHVVGTSLYNAAMPLIRYRTGDVSAIVTGECQCGRIHRRLRDVTTKAEDMVITPDGRLISPSILTHPFKPFASIDKSQIIQIARDEIVVKIVPGSGYTEEVEKELTARLRERLGSTIRIRFEVVADIPREASGKFRWVVSHIDTPYDFEWE